MGRTHDTATLVLVANNSYVIDPRPLHGTRGDLDGGVLGIIAVTGPPPGGVSEWKTPTFRVDSATPVALGIDGRERGDGGRRSSSSRIHGRSGCLSWPAARAEAPASSSATGEGTFGTTGR